MSPRHPPSRADDDTDDNDDDNIDPELRLRTVRTAASAIAESILSEQRAERRKTVRQRRSFFRRRHRVKKQESLPLPDAAPSKEILGLRRNVYVNHSLSSAEVDGNGEPKARYVRNKVRTTKYTLLTFIPKNLYEQFRRVANLFFLSLVILQLFPVFGAPNGSLAVLPLAFILTVTAIKDGIEDYRRGVIDEQVNTSAATKLSGGWKNVNQPADSRSWLEKLLRTNSPGKVTKGVRKLREREAGLARQELKVVLKQGNDDSTMSTDDRMSSIDLSRGASGRRLEDIQSVDSHSYPPGIPVDPSKISLSDSTKDSAEFGNGRFSTMGSLSQYQQSVHSQSSFGVVDWRKHIGGSARWERTLWKKLEVGDVVLLRDNDQVPADIVVLSTSDSDGMCYLETKNLDGETNLKPRKAIKATSTISSEEDIEHSSFYLDSEPPHQNLYVYNGVIRYKDSNTSEPKQQGVTINELLLRGCALRNTNWVIGLVVFTGSDTKIMLNGGDTPSKRSKIEKETNFNVIVNFCFLSIMCLISAIMSGVQDGKTGTSSEFFEQGADPTSSPVVNALVTFVSCLIAFQNIVPISLYISIEIVKTIQAYFISQDIDMYYAPYDTPCVPKTWNISDDLGQIEYVFSDKTGTLTQNVMEFQKCSIHGIVYGEGITEAQRGAVLRNRQPTTSSSADLNSRDLIDNLDNLKNSMISTMEKTFKNRYLQADKVTLVAPQLASDLADKRNPQRNHIIAFFRALALCHTALSDRPEPTTNPYLLNYKAESPDEAALVSAARDAGFPFIGKAKESVDIEVMGQIERYSLLKVLEFNSTRKRMSVVVRAPDGRLILYCKGADSVIYARLCNTFADESEREQERQLREQTSKDMEHFANNGLRTLCIAYRYLEEEEYLSWSRVYDAATSAVENRDDDIEKANEIIERDLRILGATALEDKLQEGVPEAIEMLHRAGIKLWILTGDKLQTAIEIGYSCNLLTQSMELMILSADSMEQTRSQIEAGLNKIASVLGPPTWEPKKRGFVPGLMKASFAVVIDGDTLRFALMPEVKEMFLNLGTQCETVVCCRVSPAQKALTVNLVKEGRNAMTLSIGDGANDVAMIQEANIGCGLFGLEGSQAAMSADYAFGQFRFLTKLLLVHGRWSYQRVAEMHSNFFYKNVIWTFAMFWFLPFNSFDATYLYQYTFILLYNLVFTSLPVIVLGAFDQDINAKAALAFPQLYIRGIRGLEYTRTKFWLYIGDGLYQSAIVYFIPYLVWQLGNPLSWNGRSIESLADFGTTVAVAAIFSANTFVGMNTHYWTVITWIVVVGSTVVMMLWILIYSFFRSIDFVDEVLILFGGIQFWATVLFTTTVALAPRFIFNFLSTVYYPLDKEIVREMWVMGDLKDKLGIHHRNAKKNREFLTDSTLTTNNLEAAPMFSEQHCRSMSELSTANGPYEPTEITKVTPSSSPYIGGGKSETPSPRLSQQPSSPSSPQQQQPLISSSPISASSSLSPLSRVNPNARVDTISPQPSYYSVSDLPPPSPLPATKYRLASGEVTTSPPSPSTRRSSLISSLSNSNSTLRQSLGRSMAVGMNHTSPSSSVLDAPPLGSPPPPIVIHESSDGPASTGGPSGLIRRLSGSGARAGGGNGNGRGEEEGYEMGVRSPPRLHPHPDLWPTSPSSTQQQQQQQRQLYQHEESQYEDNPRRVGSSTSFASQATSYATAEDEEFWLSTAEGDDQQHQRHPHSQQDAQLQQQQQMISQSQGSERASEETARPSYDRDRDTIIGVAGVGGQQHDRQMSAASSSTTDSWNAMGRAV